MKLCNQGIEKLVKEIHDGKDPSELIGQYDNFINKYLRMFTHGTIDFSNYDLRMFLSCYIKNETDRRNLRRGKYHSKQDYANAYEVLNYLQQAFEDYESREIYHELVIPFLICIKRYTFMNKSFSKYLYSTYRYELLRHINNLIFQRAKVTEMSQPSVELEINIKEEEEMYFDDDLKLNHPYWLNGKDTLDPFNQFRREERLILVKYYLEKYTDQEIGRLIGRNRRSVNRSRLRVIRKLEDDIRGGQVKWSRWIH